MRDLANNISCTNALSPAVQAATIKGNTIDTKGYGSLAFSVVTGAIAAAGDFTVTVQESDTTTDGDFTTVAAANLAGNNLPATLAADAAYDVSYIGYKRYARVVATKNGGTSVAIGAVAIRGRAANKPVS
ncbi:hypothetical protein [Mesorhizobium sp.]|uniref:hypothetical protein n=1 Tax=Mesorhizobium sp. TaxID=1871066 RepID=UPI000FE5CC68|nr:hypothetical protein [Mesorhizobium sp.]RWE34997.1 MAG: hypothetical protein EOS77_08470 [Mesorhizobium sp.]